ncbi:MAG: hypothetical protein E2O89_08610 [Alphaproteobacteria bacterium]|nr:MAG: hypothetical protein E2O89_08610 [Alphaproteobacteria bacterium]
MSEVNSVTDQDAPSEEEPIPLSRRAMAEPPYLADLNEAQRQAVVTTDGPVLVLAGAGTGKTRVLTTRLAYLLQTQQAWPGQILAVTFTNKAAREMQERIRLLIGGVMEGMQWLGTFHSISAKILRRHAELVGLKSNFTILDDDDQVRLLKQIIKEANIDQNRWTARHLAGLIDNWKNKGLTPDRVPAGESQSFADGKGIDLYRQYQERLKILNAADFGDLLLECIQLFQKNASILEDFQRRFKYILVDEYQDTNVAQYLWLRLLAQGRRNICCVGDDDQSIYGWRGAEVDNILRFEKDFPGARVIRLERNYRSTPHILAAASGLISANDGRLGKTLWTDLPEQEKVYVRGVWDGEEEARMVCDDIEQYQRDDRTLNDMAILVRTSAQMREFEERLINLGIPYRVIGGPRFYERAEIRDALAYLRVIAQPDDDLAFERIMNKPRRGLGKVTLQALHIAARAERISLTRAARQLIETDEIPRAKKALSDLIAMIDRWCGLIDTIPHTELAEIVLDESGYTAMWQNEKSADAPGRLENLKELVHSMAEFENLAGFLEHISLVADNNQSNAEDQVSLMTLHSAKGTEFPVVFLPGWEEGLFPHQRTLDENGLKGLEEERRLAYVGITRAKEVAKISFAANRRLFNQWANALPSRFIDELPEKNVEVMVDTGLYGGSMPAGRLNQDAAGPITSRFDQGGATPNPDAAGFDIGARVFHQKFGYGRIDMIEGNKLTIKFEKAGKKKVIASFVERHGSV